MFAVVKPHRSFGVARAGLLAAAALLSCPALAQNLPSADGSVLSVAESEPLTLETAIRRTLQASPLSSVAVARRESLQAARQAADLKPQPSVDVTVENFGPPMGDLYDQFQVTGTYSQRLERGGKRKARVNVVARDLDIAEAETIVVRLDLIRTVQQVFVEAQAAQAKIAVAQDRVRVASELQREVGRRVASAKDPVFAGTRAKTGVAEAQVDLRLAIHARDAAMRRLAALWGGPAARRVAATSDFLDLDEPASEAAPSPADLAVYEARIGRAEALTDVQRANAARDPTVSGGPRIISTRSVGLVAGVSMPLGVKRLAEARVAEAQAEGRRIAAELSVERYNRGRAIALASEKVEESRQEAELIRDEVVPNARTTLEQVRLGYNRGFFSFADVSAAQVTLSSARARMIDAARRYHEAKVELDRLTGRFSDLAREAAQ
jgi:outer membrane protein, heavy metal efflux system